MNADTLGFRGAYTISVVALALLVASCAKPDYSIGGSVSGLSGNGLVLQNNGGDNLSLAADGGFTFSRQVKKGGSYNVTVFTQPSGRPCTVANGSGTATSNVTSVAVSCGGFTVGGTVSGLAGTGLVLQNNGGDNLSISANGSFTFPTRVASGAHYSVTVFAQPAGTNCTVSNGTGTASGNVTNVAVSCASSAFTVGGTVSGLTGTGLVLQNNGGNNLSISANGPFTFSTALASGSAYSVAVLTQPTGQGCTVANGSGTVSGANVTNVAVTCAAPPGAPTVSLAFGVKELQFSWGAVSGATYYRLLENPDGASGYNLAVDNITATSYNYSLPVHRRLNALYIVDACNAAGCTSSNILGLGSNNLVPLIGYVKASNTNAGDQFGYAVALSGDGNTFAIGAPNEASSATGIGGNQADNSASSAGAVYVFTRIGGVWTQQAYVKASNTAATDSFGIAVALSSDGNTLAVGAYNQGGSGAVYMFTRSSGTWSQQTIVKASNAEASDQFGWAVALSGDGNTLAVGAPNEASAATGVGGNQGDNSAPGAGAVYVFTRGTGNWPQQAYVKASNTETFDMFGYSVGLSSDGSTLAVGALLENSAATGIGGNQSNDCATTATNCAMFSGSAYVFTRSGAAWSQQAYVKASNTAANDNFGNSIALSGDGNTLAVGSPFQANMGAGYVFARSAGTWSQQAIVQASNAGANDWFGWSIALSGDGNSLAVGAPLEDSSGSGIGTTPDDLASDAGAAYFFTRSGASWSQQSFVKASNTTTPEADRFGWSVTLSNDGNTLVVGASFEDGSGTGIDNAGLDNALSAGAAYLY